MTRVLIKSIGFFLLIKLIFILIGGSVELLFSDGSNPDQYPTIISTLAFPISAISIGLIILWRFPLIFRQCISWLYPLWRNLLHFSLMVLTIGLLFTCIVYLGKSAGFVIPNTAISHAITLKVLASLFIITLMVGFTEEFIYRGVISAYFIEKIGVRATIIIVSFLFSLGHFYYVGLLPFISAFTMGIVSVMLLLKTGSLYASIGLHCGWNFIYFIFEKFYNLNTVVVPFWGNLFELYQIGLLCIILIPLLFYKGVKNSYISNSGEPAPW